MARRKKLLHVLAVRAQMLRYLFPDSRGGKSVSGVCGVVHNAGSFADSACGVNVYDGVNV